MRIEESTFAMIDTETTGSKPGFARPCQVSVLLVKNGKNLGQKTWLINPEMRIPPDAAGFHQITNDLVKDAPTLEQVKGEIQEFLGDAVPVSYKAAFHQAMLPFVEREWICCQKLARHSFDFGEENSKGFPLEQHGDQYLRYWLGLEVETPKDIPCHNAEADVRTFAGIFAVAVERFLKAGYTDDTGSLIAFANRPAPLTRISLGIYRDTPIEEIETSWLRNQAFGIKKGEINLEPDLEYTILAEYEKRTARRPSSRP